MNIYLLKVVGTVGDLEGGRVVVRVEAAERRLEKVNLGCTNVIELQGCKDPKRWGE